MDASLSECVRLAPSHVGANRRVCNVIAVWEWSTTITIGSMPMYQSADLLKHLELGCKQPITVEVIWYNPGKVLTWAVSCNGKAGKLN